MLAKIRAEVEKKEKKRPDEIRMAGIQAEAEEKKRVDEIQAEEKRRADEIEIQIANIALQQLHLLVMGMPSPQSYHIL